MIFLPCHVIIWVFSFHFFVTFFVFSMHNYRDSGSILVIFYAIPVVNLEVVMVIMKDENDLYFCLQRERERERAIVVNLEFIKAIVTAEEVLLLDPLRHEVIPFVEQLRQQLPYKTQPKLHGPAYERELEMQVSNELQWLSSPKFDVSKLESDAYPVLHELAKNVSTNNLDFVRSLKSNLTRFLARVQKVRDEIEHLLDDNENMRRLYLSRNGLVNHQIEAHSTKSESPVSRNDYNDVEELEMLLEAYFMQLDSTRNKILSVSVHSPLSSKLMSVFNFDDY
ncbi:hypothetical protein Lalb_Chr13g0295641 [Lupinus albus]|uniref:Magnesium transporter n=1 Tax=Lupinus albus TaxID=3870 RepID=A0A6A4PI57_LUPAL|nr:hypothetical protein Lalb_Chr13g0295641 [Lupinus albus]